MWNTLVDPTIVDGVVADATANAKETVQAIKDTILSETDKVTPATKEALAKLGFDSGKSLTDNINSGVLSNIHVVRDAATGTVIGFKKGVKGGVTAATPEMLALFNALGIGCNDSMENGVSSETLTPPNVDQPDTEKWTTDLTAAVQRDLSKKEPVTIKVNGKMNPVADWFPKGWIGATWAGAPKFANGGIATEPSIAGEAGPEMIIPLSPSKRPRAVELFEQTAGMIGRDSPAILDRMREAVAANQSRMYEKAVAYNTQNIINQNDFSGIADAVKQGLSGAKVEANGRQIGEVVFENWDRVVRTHGGR